MSYKTTLDLENHLQLIRANILCVISLLAQRGIEHDKSKFSSIELESYIDVKDKLSEVAFGSVEYDAIKVSIQPAIDHHYIHNRHHPEHFNNGVNDMNIIDLIEMFCDWLAANKRNSQNNPHDSIEICGEKYQIPNMLKQIFHNSVELF